MSDKGLLWIIIIELGLLLFGLYSAAQKAQTAINNASANPFVGLLSNL